MFLLMQCSIQTQINRNWSTKRTIQKLNKTKQKLTNTQTHTHTLTIATKLKTKNIFCAFVHLVCR